MSVSPNSPGFTLVELLIVVAIIGVLATLGVPTYRKMIQKARKAEAQQALGDIYKVEAAFFAEFGSYTNNLEPAGFSIDSPPGFPEGATSGRYAVGFPQGGTCNSAFYQIYPTDAEPRDRIVKTLPSFSSLMGAIWMPVQIWSTAIGTTTPCEPSFVSADGQTYRATASGVLHSGDLVTTPLSDRDIWTLDEQRRLSNTQDGIR